MILVTKKGFIQMEIGLIIRKRRVAMKMTQEELADRLNVTAQAVSRWENEISLPDIALIPRISNVLGLSCDTLLKEKDERSICFMPAGITVDTAEIMIQNDINMLFGFEKKEGKPERLSILHADDSEFLRKMVRDAIGEQGYEVIEAKDGVECMDVLLKQKPDVLLLDINMPGYNGLEVLEQVTRDYSDIPVLILSAVADKKTVQETLRLGARGFIAKPFGVVDLIDWVLSIGLNNG